MAEMPPGQAAGGWCLLDLVEYLGLCQALCPVLDETVTSLGYRSVRRVLVALQLQHVVHTLAADAAWVVWPPESLCSQQLYSLDLLAVLEWVWEPQLAALVPVALQGAAGRSAVLGLLARCFALGLEAWSMG